MMMFANCDAETGEIYAICSELLGLPDKANFIRVEAEVGVGWQIVDGVAVAPPKPAPIPEPLTPVTRKQLIDVLIDHDLDEQVEPVLNAISDNKTRKKALNAWRNASHYEPDHSLVLHLKEALNLTDAQYEKLWREAMIA